MDLNFLEKEFPGKGVITKLNGNDAWQLPGKKDALTLTVKIINDKYHVTISTNPITTERYVLSLSVVGAVLKFLDTA